MERSRATSLIFYGFRGQVTSVSASDPYATHDPFTLEYEITMPKFVDWSKKPVRIPALLPQLGLPEPPAKRAAGAATSPIELGTPLEVETHMTLQLPPGTTALTPTGTSVQRDYATFASHYEAKGSTITASRHINFILRELSRNARLTTTPSSAPSRATKPRISLWNAQTPKRRDHNWRAKNRHVEKSFQW